MKQNSSNFVEKKTAMSDRKVYTSPRARTHTRWFFSVSFFFFSLFICINADADKKDRVGEEKCERESKNLLWISLMEWKKKQQQRKKNINVVQAHKARHTNLLSTSSFARPFSWICSLARLKCVQICECAQVWFSISRFVKIKIQMQRNKMILKKNRLAFSVCFFFGLCACPSMLHFAHWRTPMDSNFPLYFNHFDHFVQ